MAKQNKKHKKVLHFSLHGKREEYEKGFRIDELFPLNTNGINTHNKPIISIVFVRQKSKVGFRYEIASRLLTDVISISSRAGENLIIFPLYRYPETSTQRTIAHRSPPLGSFPQNIGRSGEVRSPNLNPEITQKIAKNLGLSFIPEKEPEGKVCYINNPEVRDDFKTTFAPIDLLDYIYAILHSPTYNEKYKKFLKIGFPRVPYPKAEEENFWQLVKLGGELRQIYLLEGQPAGNPIVQFPVGGDTMVKKVKFVSTPTLPGPIATQPNLTAILPGPAPIPHDPTPIPPEGEGARTHNIDRAEDNFTHFDQQHSSSLPSERIGKTTSSSFNKQRSSSPPSEGPGEVVKAVGVKRTGEPRYITANPAHYSLIKEMRDVLKDNPTEAEKTIWEYLRNKKTGHKIRRQHIIDDFITDFVCLAKKVVIEIDGKIHLKQKEYDELRTAILNELGYGVVRFTNEEVFANPEVVANKIKTILDKKKDTQIDEITDPTLPGPIATQPNLTAILPGSAPIPHDPTPIPHDPTPTLPEGEGARTHNIDRAEDNFTHFDQQHSSSLPSERMGKTTSSSFNKQRSSSPPSEGPGEVREPGEVKSPLEFGKTIGKVYINDLQFFDNFPETIWKLKIGGYQPAQKWLKDRRGQILQFEDVLHYQKIIMALTETDRLMKEIDKIGVE